eukprot:366508-Chlamydomonas_euryale.AAC.5
MGGCVTGLRGKRCPKGSGVWGLGFQSSARILERDPPAERRTLQATGSRRTARRALGSTWRASSSRIYTGRQARLRGNVLFQHALGRRPESVWHTCAPSVGPVWSWWGLSVDLAYALFGFARHPIRAAPWPETDAHLPWARRTSAAARGYGRACRPCSAACPPVWMRRPCTRSLLMRPTATAGGHAARKSRFDACGVSPARTHAPPSREALSFSCRRTCCWHALRCAYGGRARRRCRLQIADCRCSRGQMAASQQLPCTQLQASHAPATVTATATGVAFIRVAVVGGAVGEVLCGRGRLLF